MEINKKITELDQSIQEQLYKGICKKCNKINEIKSKTKPSHCMKCGLKINYYSSESLVLREAGEPQ